MDDTYLIQAYRHSARHRPEVFASAECGCFNCLSIFDSSEIKTWIDTGLTAVCPRCGMDAVLPSASGVPLGEELLRAMQDRWFPQSKTA